MINRVRKKISITRMPASIRVKIAKLGNLGWENEPVSVRKNSRNQNLYCIRKVMTSSLISVVYPFSWVRSFHTLA